MRRATPTESATSAQAESFPAGHMGAQNGPDRLVNGTRLWHRHRDALSTVRHPSQYIGMPSTQLDDDLPVLTANHTQTSDTRHLPTVHQPPTSADPQVSGIHQVGIWRPWAVRVMLVGPPSLAWRGAFLVSVVATAEGVVWCGRGRWCGCDRGCGGAASSAAETACGWRCVGCGLRLWADVDGGVSGSGGPQRGAWMRSVANPGLGWLTESCPEALRSVGH
jgi:hypothetical protein